MELERHSRNPRPDGVFHGAARGRGGGGGGWRGVAVGLRSRGPHQPAPHREKGGSPRIPLQTSLRFTKLRIHFSNSRSYERQDDGRRGSLDTSVGGQPKVAIRDRRPVRRLHHEAGVFGTASRLRHRGIHPRPHSRTSATHLALLLSARAQRPQHGTGEARFR